MMIVTVLQDDDEGDDDDDDENDDDDDDDDDCFVGCLPLPKITNYSRGGATAFPGLLQFSYDI